jgi:hypothetical protein
MTASRNAALMSAIMAAATMILSSCNLPEPKEARDGDGSTFAVSSFEGKVISRNVDPKNGIPISNVYNYKACLTDLRQKKPMIGHKFQVMEITKDLATDINGCLMWPETVEYNFLTSSKYLKIIRTLRGMGPHHGDRPIPFAIDPWSHGEASPKDAIDLSKSSIPEDWLVTESKDVETSLLGTSLSQKKDGPTSLWLETGRLLAVEDRVTDKGFEVTYEFHSTPQIALTRMDGQRAFYDVAEGAYKGKMLLIQTILEGGKVQRKILAEKSFDSVNIDNKNLAFKARFNFLAPYWGHLYLAVQVSPTTPRIGLKTFEGIYYMGDYKSLTTNAWLKLSSVVHDNPDFKLENFLAGKYETTDSQETAPTASSAGSPAQGTATASTSPTAPRGEDDFNNKSQIFIPQLSFNGARIEQDSGHRRLLKYQVQACFKYPTTGEPIKGRPFTVTKFRQSPTETAQHASDKPLISQMDGCIVWGEEMVVEAYDCQKFIKGFVVIESPDLGVNRTINYFINPWLSTPDLALDEIKFQGVLGKECDGAKADEKPAYIYLTGLSYNLLDISHELDPNLNIIINRNVQMDFDLTLINNSNLKGGRDGSERLKDGLYLVKMILTESPDLVKEPKYISSSFKIVQSSGSHITLNPVTFRFLNPQDIANRNRLMIQILPVDQSKVAPSADRSSWTLGKDIKTYDEIVDPRARLVPLIYDSKIVMSGEIGKGTTVDPKKVLLEAVMAGQSQFLPELTDLLKQRQKLLDTMVTSGQAQQAVEVARVSETATTAGYAKNLSLVLFNLDDSKAYNTTYLQKVAGINLNPLLSFGAGSVVPKTRFGQAVSAANPVSLEQLAAMINSPQLNPEFAKRLCAYYMAELLAPALTADGSHQLTIMCARMSNDSAQGLLIKETVYHVNKAANFNYIGGSNEVMGLSTSFAMTSSHSESHTQTISGSVGFKLPEFLIFGAGGQTSIAKANSSAESQSNTVTVTNNIPLRNQTSITQFDMIDYEICTRIRVNPNLFVKEVDFFDKFNPFKTNYNKFLATKKTGQEVIDLLNRGVLICQRPKDMPPLRKTEKFYIVQQDPNPGEIQDGPNSKNRFLFMVLRGEEDFKRFELFTKGEAYMPGGFNFKDLNADESNARLRQAFSVRPSAPRIYVEPVTKN